VEFSQKTARLMGKNIYQLKSELLADYLKKELKYPKIRLTFVEKKSGNLSLN
jgi:hypothetical protein